MGSKRKSSKNLDRQHRGRPSRGPALTSRGSGSATNKLSGLARATNPTPRRRAGWLTKLADANRHTPAGWTEMPRLVLVSNRVPAPGQRGQAAGGLAVALHNAAHQRDCLWFGWSGNLTDSETPLA